MLVGNSINDNEKCRQIARDFDCHADAAVRRGSDRPPDQPRDAAQREECSDLDEKSFNYFCRCDGRAKGIC